MDPNVATIIVAIFTGIFSIITLLIQKDQRKLLSKIDEQTVFMEKEKAIKQRISELNRQRDIYIQEMTLLKLDAILRVVLTDPSAAQASIDDIINKTNEIEVKYNDVIEEIDDANKEYELIINMGNEIKDMMKEKQKKRQNNNE
jgi:predicted transcriptional regulator with HTH domain